MYDGTKMPVPNYGMTPRDDFAGGGDLRSSYLSNSGMYAGEELFGGANDLRASYDSAGYGDYVLPEGINPPVRYSGMAYSA